MGRGSHPTAFASTSPVFYGRHQDVVNFTIDAARDFRPNAPLEPARDIVIGNDVYIGHGAFVMQGVRIGDGAVVGAQSVVTKDVPAYAIVAGSPARIRKMRFSEATIERYPATPWWRYAFWDLGGLPVADPEAFIAGVEDRAAAGLKPYAPDVVDLKTLR